MPDLPRASQFDIYQSTVMIDKSEILFLKFINHNLRTEDRPCNRLAKTPPTNLRTSTLRTLDNFRRNFNPSSIFDCFTTKPAHWDHVTRGPVRSSSSPDLSRPGSARATRGPLATHKTRTKLGLLSAVLRCLPYAVPLTSSDTAPVPARLGSVRPTNSQPAQAAFNPQMGCSGTLLPEKANGYKVLVGP